MAQHPFEQSIKAIILKARRRGVVDFNELVKAFPAGVSIAETNKVIDELTEYGIKVSHQRVNPKTQPRQQETLLTREQEIALARRIRAGQSCRLKAALKSPLTVKIVIQTAQRVRAGTWKVWDVLADFEGSHPDDDTAEARERLNRVSSSMKKDLQRLRRLVSPQAVRKNHSDRMSSIHNIRAKLNNALSELDFKDSFISLLLKPLIAESSKVKRASTRLLNIEKQMGQKLSPIEDFSDAQIRKSLKNMGLSRSAREQISRDIKKIKRTYQTARNKIDLSTKEILKVGQQVKKGEMESNQARQALVEANQRLVMSIARRYPHFSMDFLDLVQEGNLGLMRAADRFDPDRGFRFGTYAAWWVRQSIGRLVAEQGGAVRIPPHVQESLHKVNRISRRLVLKTGKEPRVEELAKHLGKTPKRIKEILAAGRRPISTETQVGDDDDSAKLLDFIPDPHAGPDEEADLRVQQAVLQDAMSALTEREQHIISMRFHEDLTLQEVGDHYGITRERTRQLEAQALRKLRKRLKADLLRRLIKDEPFQNLEDSGIVSQPIRKKIRPPGEKPT
jgi:RNA polymerase primary sigma factor